MESSKYMRIPKKCILVIEGKLFNNCPKLDFSLQKCHMLIHMMILNLVIKKSNTKIEQIAKNPFRSGLVAQFSALSSPWPRKPVRDQEFSVTRTCYRDQYRGNLVATRNPRSTLAIPGNNPTTTKSRPAHSGHDREFSVKARSRPGRCRGPPGSPRSPVTWGLRTPATVAGHCRPLLTTAYHRWLSPATVDHRRPQPPADFPANFWSNFGRPLANHCSRIRRLFLPVFQRCPVFRFELCFVIRFAILDLFRDPIIISESVSWTGYDSRIWLTIRLIFRSPVNKPVDLPKSVWRSGWHSEIRFTNRLSLQNPFNEPVIIPKSV